MELTRRRALLAAATAGGIGATAGCLEGSGGSGDAGASETSAQSSFFVFGDIADHVAGDAAASELLVPVGQHGHGWEPGPRVREDIGDADLFVHGMEGFQPWVDNIRGDLLADGADVATVDASADVSLLEAGDHRQEEDDHDGEDHEEGDDHDSGAMDPHFWMDPIRTREAVGTISQGFADVDPANADTYIENAESFGAQLEDLHERIDSLVAEASSDVLLVAGHDSFSYFVDRYGVTVESLTNVSPDDRPTSRDIERAREVVETHGIEYLCADPLESQQAAEQLAEETNVEGVLPLTAMPGLTDEWDADGWGYVGIMENVNIPTLEQALDA
ncbi:metal ABC transporter substrate-binding protein [Natronomonas sp. F2-12]|jgi:zinc transport system substrate-binding protein|uniref:Metal ABC transporter substrate-binding protein n=1 Tax=Natronomonas aquatica TaxID=2841590 RepID=A0A9R1CRC7_9EURY|nr:metal ABC transporter substrate-binding protein [Natronomonas aquatica]MCQ4332274.1 metal ABC transporter substrate-binding protein [Natronomonas aquatica]